MNITLKVCLASLIIVMSLEACGSKQSFKADDKAAGESGGVEDQKTENPTPVVPYSESPPLCTDSEARITQVKLLNSGIATKTANNIFRYELSVLECKDGSLKNLSNLSVGFDLEAKDSNYGANISYKIFDTKKAQISSGILTFVEGSDLFGNIATAGTRFGHLETKTLSASSTVDKIILEIDTSGHIYTPTELGRTSIDSYIKVGDAQAVTQELKILD